jgi:phage tail-like protein
VAITAPGTVKDIEIVGSWFSIELKIPVIGDVAANFKEASGLAIEVNSVEITDAMPKTGGSMTRKRPGQTTYGDIVLKRTLSKDQSFFKWAKMIRDGVPEYRANGAIVLHDKAGVEVSRWTFSNAWPSKWSASDLDVGTDDPMIEEITLAVELLARTK